MGEGYTYLFHKPPPRAQQLEDAGQLRLFAQAESIADARRCLHRARAVDTAYRAELLALEQLAQELWISVLRRANGEEPATR